MPNKIERQNQRDEINESTHDMVALLIEKVEELTKKVEALSEKEKKSGRK